MGNKLYKLKDIKNINVKKEKEFSILIEGLDEYYNTYNDAYIDFIKKNKNKIRKFIINLPKFNIINTKKYLFLEKENIEVYIISQGGFVEEGIKKFQNSIEELLKIKESLFLESKNQKEILINMIKWACKNLNYDFSYNIEGKTQEEKEKLKERLLLSHNLKEKKTNCAGFANMTYILGKILGLHIFVLKSKTHNWNAVRIYGKTYEFDPIKIKKMHLNGKLNEINFKNFYLTKKDLKKEKYLRLHK